MDHQDDPTHTGVRPQEHQTTLTANDQEQRTQIMSSEAKGSDRGDSEEQAVEDGPETSKPHFASIQSIEDGRGERHSTGEVGDVDRCRICRGEGSKEEELFYPCKCNGSIRYVHQNCLVEWLSHSHKKHCELCKTPFRFTKLYDAHMPRSVPVPVFLRQALVNGWKSLLTYIRVILVVFVWCFWLPWCMRAVWRGLFWLGDGGWVDWKKRSLANSAAGEPQPIVFLGFSHMTSKLSEALASSFISTLSNGWTRHRSTLQNFWEAEKELPFTFRFFNSIHRLLIGEKPDFSPQPTSGTFPTPTPNVPTRPTSWLSDISFLRSATRSPTLNGIIIDTLEGQLITGVIIATFIVLFLIREWVVQQQQNLFMGVDAQQDGDVQHIAVVQNGEANEGRVGGHQAEQAADVQQMQAQAPQRIVLQPTRRLQRRATHTEGVDLRPQEEINATNDRAHSTALEADGIEESLSDEDRLTRPAMPDRGTTGAVEIRRDLDDNTDLPSDQDQAGVQVFKDLWSRADQKPANVLRIIDEEHKNDDLDWIVKFMKKLEDVPSNARLSLSPSAFNTQLELESLQPSFESEKTMGTVEHSSHNSERPNTAEREDMFKSMLLSDRASTTGSEAPRIFPSDKRSEQFDALQLDQPQLVDMPLGTDSRPNSQAQKNQVLAVPASSSPADLGEVQDTGNLISDENPSDLMSERQEDAIDRVNDSLSPTVVEEAHTEPPAGKGPLEYLMDLMWGETPSTERSRTASPVEDEERRVVDIADEAPFVPANRQQLLPPPEQADNQGPPPNDEVAAPALPAGADAAAGDGLDELEDVDGVMDLIGMQGPLFVLVQNGMFCAFLVSASIAATLFVPYMTGKMFLIALAHPLHMMKQPLRIASMAADVIVDSFVVVIGLSYYWVDRLVWTLCWPVRWMFPPLGKFMQTSLVADYTKLYVQRALSRLASAELMGTLTRGPDIPRFSIVAHHSLKILITTASDGLIYILNVADQATTFIQSTNNFWEIFKGVYHQLNAAFWRIEGGVSGLLSLAPSLLSVNPWKISLGTSSHTHFLDWTLASWSPQDRSIAILLGYLFFFLLGLSYLQLTAMVKGTNRKGLVEGELANGLYQAGGVLKVILIISIEMIVFPLYCGVLLDIAMLPLFGNATVGSRAAFALASPRVSLFMHWFIGTCYMFHFALFVSMCRKIMRTGVLFFIRDPDDPTFHPVRDVLERNLTAQLSKISFSGLVYAGLILGSLGGVVWGLARWTTGIFPIKWSSSEPILEFPIDVLFYNFFMPLVIKYCKPANGLTKVYDWWLRKCARFLRLSNFLFKEDHLDEKGAHIRRTWKGWLTRSTADLSKIDNAKDGTFSVTRGDATVAFKPDGKMVQAPSSDQLRIPKGIPTFFEISEVNEFVNVDGKSKAFFDKNHESFAIVYIPPHFKMRISALVVLLWLFAATTGMSVTVLPLLVGRFILSQLAPQYLSMNDIYSVSIGLYLLGGTGYAVLNFNRFRTYINNKVSPHTSTIKSATQKAGHVAIHILGLIYTYSAFTILSPALISLLIECYFVIPLGTFLASFHPFADQQPLSIASTFSSTGVNVPSVLSRPMIHLIQDWTLGILYTKVIGRLILWSAPSRPATALRGIVRHGWLNPDTALATRGFILPATTLVAILLAIPAAIGWLAAKTILSHVAARSDLARTCIYRYAYPAVLIAAIAVLLLWVLGEAFGRWRRRVRDEVYLIGERLHNYGETKKVGGGSADKRKGKEKEMVERPVLTRTATA